MRTPNQCCGTCDAWVAMPGQVGQNKPGACHGGRPTVFQVMAPTPGLPGLNGKPTMQILYQAAFPPMAENDWCREWAPKDGLAMLDQTFGETKGAH
jgi:hypothetical protein